MAGRPLDPDELTAIAAYLSQHGAKRCPPTGRGPGTLPFMAPLTMGQRFTLAFQNLREVRKAAKARAA
jgi:hypothetical protein